MGSTQGWESLRLTDTPAHKYTCISQRKPQITDAHANILKRVVFYFLCVSRLYTKKSAIFGLIKYESDVS